MTEPDETIAANIAADPVDGTLSESGGRWVLTLVRELRQPAAVVWPMLTDPAKLAQWAPMTPAQPFTSTGVIPSASAEMPDEYEVLVVAEPHEVRYRWGGDLLRWTLTPTDTGCRLTLEHTFDERSDRGSFAAGWHICFAVLAARLAGSPGDAVTGELAQDYGWARLRDAYDDAL